MAGIELPPKPDPKPPKDDGDKESDGKK